MSSIPHPVRPVCPAGAACGHAAGDAALASLGFAARLVIWAARRWMTDKGDPHGSGLQIAEAFRLARCQPALPALDEIMLMAVHGACRPVSFGAEAGLTSDEVALLRSVAAFQDEAVIGGERALETWLPASTARLASEPALRLARALGRAGLYVRPRGRTN
mgnify:CR=1 FL=1